VDDGLEGGEGGSCGHEENIDVTVPGFLRQSLALPSRSGPQALVKLGNMDDGDPGAGMRPLGYGLAAPDDDFGNPMGGRIGRSQHFQQVREASSRLDSTRVDSDTKRLHHEGHGQ
jgi:hypothetical protein